MHVQFTPGLDVAELVLEAFTLFFIGLVIYLRREDRREGYPVEDDRTGRILSHGGPLNEPRQKLFRLPHGRGTVVKPDYDRDPFDLPARSAGGFHGAPLVPTGNPLVDGVGPAAWAERRRVPDLDWEGRPRIARLRDAADVTVSRRDPTLIGWTLVDLDRKAAGTIEELWVDRLDRLVRYLEVRLDGGRTVLAPMAMAKVNARGRFVMVDALTAAQMAEAPVPETDGVLTFYDEERILAYFGGGYLYATPARAEPLL